jgi:hypothetical protein
MKTSVFLFVIVAAVDLVRVALTLPRNQFGDEWRYLQYANNLLHGYFSPHGRVFLLNGPIYPLTLVPFVESGWLDGARYLNAVYHAAAVAYAWPILRGCARPPWALAAVALLVLYMPLQEHVPLLYTESLSFFLATAWVYHSLNGVAHRAHRMAAGLYLALLVLTKVVFGPVLALFLAILFVMWLRRRDQVSEAYLMQAAVAFALCMPYLAYTYQLTGRIFYWSSAGANNFYWLTSPYPDEWGDWYHQGWVYGDPLLLEHHKDIFDQTTGLATNPDLSEEEQLFNMSTPEAGDIFMARARANVRAHPLKFVRNWCANVVRLFLDVPVTVRGTPVVNQYSVSHLPLLIWTGVVVAAGWRRRTPPDLVWAPLMAFGVLTVAAYSLVSSMARFLIPIVPLWWLATCVWFARTQDSRA